MQIWIATTVTFRGRAFPVIAERSVEGEPSIGHDLVLAESGDQWIEETSRSVDTDGRLVITGRLRDKTGAFTQDFDTDGGAVLWAAGFMPNVRTLGEDKLQSMSIDIGSAPETAARQVAGVVAHGVGTAETRGLPGWYQDAVSSWARSRGSRPA